MACSPDGHRLTFKWDNVLCGGMPYIDLTAYHELFIVWMDSITEVAMMQTVQGNYEEFSRKEVQMAIAARDVQTMMTNPSHAAIKNLVSSTNAVKNLGITIPTIMNAQLSQLSKG